jgi:hypothetical protein
MVKGAADTTNCVGLKILVIVVVLENEPVPLDTTTFLPGHNCAVLATVIVVPTEAAVAVAALFKYQKYCCKESNPPFVTVGVKVMGTPVQIVPDGLAAIEIVVVLSTTVKVAVPVEVQLDTDVAVAV